MQIAKLKRESKDCDEFEELSSILIDVLNRVMNRSNSFESLSIVSVIPSILHQIDASYVAKIIEFEGIFENEYELLHSIGELNLTDELSTILRARIKTLLKQKGQYASSLLNLSVFLYELHRKKLWAHLVREIMNEIAFGEMANCALLLKSRRSCIRQLAMALCVHLEISEKMDVDLFLLFVLYSCESASASRTLKVLTTKNRLSAFSLKEYPMGVVNFTDIVDCFYCICSSRRAAQQIDEIARLIMEVYIQTRNPEILTFAVFNEEESKIFLDASIGAIVLTAKSAPYSLAEKVDIIALLSIASKSAVKRLLEPIIGMTVSVPQLFDPVTVWLKKMITRPSEVRQAVHYFKSLINSTKDAKDQLELVRFLIKQIRTPLMESYVFACLAEVNVPERLKPEIQRLVKKESLTFRNILFRDNKAANLVEVRHFPAPAIRLVLALGGNPSDFSDLVDDAMKDLQESCLDIDLALRADVLSVLSPYFPLAFDLFCEYFRAVEILASKEHRELISEWCSFAIDPSFLQTCLKKRKYQDSLHAYVVIRQLKLNDTDLETSVMKVILDLYNNPRKDPKRAVKCKFLEQRKVFEEDYIRFREELCVFISQRASLGDVSIEASVEGIVNDCQQYSLTPRHFDAYLTIFDRAFEVSALTSNSIFSILSSLNIEDGKVLSKIVLLALNKSPGSDAFHVADVVLKCATTDDETIVLSTKVLKTAALVSVCDWLGSYAMRNKAVDDDVLDIMFRLLSVPNPGSQLAKRIVKLMNQIISTAQKTEMLRLKDFTESCERWFGQWRHSAGVRECGRCSAKLQMLSQTSKSTVGPQTTRFGRRKWRSKTKWIDEGLQEETDSDDNYADLEGFIVDESPEEEDSS